MAAMLIRLPFFSGPRTAREMRNIRTGKSALESF